MANPTSPGTDDGHVHISGQANEPMSRPAHCLASASVVRELHTDAAKGLGAEEAAARLERHGNSSSLYDGRLSDLHMTRADGSGPGQAKMASAMKRGSSQSRSWLLRWPMP